MVTSWQIKEQQVEPYNKLALIYDDIMFHVDYETWAYYISRIIKKWHPATRKVMDISCGTATLLLQLDSRYQKYGFDYSLNMVREAKLKIKLNNQNIPVWVQDMTNFALRKPVDVVLCLYDSINYLMNNDSYAKLFKCVANALTKDGLFIFDICTEKNSIKYFANYFERDRGYDYSYTRRCKYDKKERIHYNIFKIKFRSSDTTFVEIHKQRIYKIVELQKLIAANNNFRIIGVFDEFSFNQASEKSSRVNFVLKKVR